MDQSIIRISKELSDIQRSSDLGIAVACRDIDVRNVTAIVMGPHETPYEFGFFEFVIQFNQDYPSRSPSVLFITTNGGHCRFNPNLYASGKVCLSILGTWRGRPGEEWSSAQGLESILLSIQSLMSPNPFENEPGFEKANSPRDKKFQKDYVQKIRHETLRITVIQRMERYLRIKKSLLSTDQGLLSLKENAPEVYDANTPFEPFKDLCKRKFLWYFDSYLAAIRKAKEEVSENQPFTRMPFESLHNNSMEGVFRYAELEKRLHRIKATIDAEPESWAKEGLQEHANETTVAVNLQHQYEQVNSYVKHRNASFDVVLEENNPFVWIVTYFGNPMTTLDGGVFRIKMSFSPRFPSEQPRVRFETKIFHHHIAADGTPCYNPNPMRIEDVKSHIDSIIEILEDEDPAYDPRKIVNPEATKLYWGKREEDKKQYSRRLRRSIERSMEDFPE